MFPDWLNEVLDQLPMHANQAQPEWSRGRVDYRTNESSEITWGTDEIASLTCKKLCHGCNTGWMADLETASKPLLEPMILGRAQTLNPVEQLTVGTWTAKTAMVCESTYGEEGVFSTEERQIVKDHNRPPHSVRVHAAALEDLIPPLRFGLARAVVQRDGKDIGNVHFYTLQINTLVLQIIRYDPPPANYGPLKEFAVPHDIEVPVFPPVPAVTGFYWPPKVSLSNEGFPQYLTRSANPPPLPRAGPDHDASQ